MTPFKAHRAQFAIAQGARAIITSSSDDKLAKVVEHIDKSRNHGGAGELVTHNYAKDPAWDEAVLRVTDEGAEHILEVGLPGVFELIDTDRRCRDCGEMYVSLS